MRKRAEYNSGSNKRGPKQELIAKLTRQGYFVLPNYELTHLSSEAKPPKLFIKNTRWVTPDLLCLHPSKEEYWCEVDGKGKPAWFRKYSRWQHGIDYALFSAYQEIQKRSKKRVNLAVQEIASPLHPDQQSELAFGTHQWLFIWLDNAMTEGEHMPEWPGGAKQPNRRGRDGMGGWLWPRNAMTRDPFDSKTVGGLLF